MKTAGDGRRRPRKAGTGAAWAAAMAFVLSACAGPGLPIAPRDGMPYPPAAPQAGEIYHVPTGLKVLPEGMMDAASPSRVIFVGEAHQNVHAHAVQLEVIRELNRRFPAKVAVGMEMFRADQQEALDGWSRGELTEAEFLKASRWFDNWASDFGYYREILEYARDNRLDVVALNPPRALQAKVSMTPFEMLPPEVRAELPSIDDQDPYARATLKGIFAGHKTSEKMFDSFFRVQQLWEESMAQSVVDYLSSERGRDKKMVALTGSGHVQYGYNVPKKVMRRMPLDYTIILPEAVSIPEEKKEELLMDVDLPELPLYIADYIWWVNYDDLEDQRVLLGVRMTVVDGKVLVEGVEEGLPAEKAGILKGDELVGFDGQPVNDMGDVRIFVFGKRDGDKAELTVRRDGRELTIPVTFFKK